MLRGSERLRRSTFAVPLVRHISFIGKSAWEIWFGVCVLAYQLGDVVRVVARVTEFDSLKGYGFVECKEIPRDILLHRSTLPDGMIVHQGDIVVCDVYPRTSLDRWQVRVVELVNGQAPDWSGSTYPKP